MHYVVVVRRELGLDELVNWGSSFSILRHSVYAK